ncbi:MAG: amidohydrolase family protein [Acidobacteria bacterium]|nr:amidohydrolase family protein [Acidobacteriota bacterium]MYJ03417.1 amidohydrolase family protein [Acidobacteriota bacterium]
MPATGSTVTRTLTYLAAVLAVFVGVLMALPEPTPPPPADAATEAPPEGSFAIVGAKVFDGEAFQPETDVWVEDGRIHRMGRGLDLPGDLARVDGRGRTLAPGLIDGHVHTFGGTLNDAVRFGVTTVLDQFTDPQLAASKRPARETLDRGNEADLFSAGMLATAAGGHGTQYGVPVETVSGPDEAPAWVRARKAEGSDWIKIIWEDGSAYGQGIATLDRDTIAALIAAAHGEGLRAVVHVSALEHALDAVALGADGLVHVWGDTVIDDVQAARIADAGVFVVPTLSVMATVGGESMAPALLEAAGDTPLSYMQRSTLAARFSGTETETTSGVDDVALENVRRLYAAGVKLIAGTDAPNPGTASGLSMHGELRLLARAGLTAAEALIAATVAGAEAFGIDDRGRIAAGRLADLVLVDGDLESDLSLSMRIVTVWKDGYPVDRDHLDQDWQQTTAAPTTAPATTLIADFEDGLRASFGFGWQITTDGMQGGSSTARVAAENGALRVEGEVATGSPFPWAGVTYFPGAQPMQPVDFSDRETLRFRARGDGRTYIVMLFIGDTSTTVPAMAPFTATAEWSQVEIPLGQFPSASPGIIGGLAFVAQAPPLGAFGFEIDDVEIR